MATSAEAAGGCSVQEARPNRILDPRMRFFFICIAYVLSGAAFGQSWPVKPVRVIVPFAAGGITDSSARLVALSVQETLGQPLIVENKPGASGVIATAYVARSAPDGYTFLMGSAAPQTLWQFVQKVEYDGLKDFAPVTNINTFPLVLMVHPSVPAHSVKELIALAKARPGTLNFAGAGGLTQFAGEVFKFNTGIDMVHVPYKGGALATAAAAAGDAQVTFANYSDALTYMKSGRLRPLGMTSAKRFPQSPEVPTIAEAGVPGYQIESWNGLFAPAATPANIVARMASAVQAAYKDPAVRKRMQEMGAEPVGNSPAEFHAFVEAEIKKWARFVKESGIKVE